jgi:tripartite-type tricarboxylate transporter receptor subunit TctC
MSYALRILSMALVALGLPAGGVFAQSPKYPVKPIRMIVPFAPGGGTDIVGRTIAQKMSEALGQSVVVDNRGGAGGTIGAEMAVRAAPDGYTVIMVSGSYGTNAALYNLAYDPVNDIQTIAMIGESGFVLALHPGVPVKSVAELITLAKSKPGALNYGSTGTGGLTHLATELFELLAGTKMTHVPYKGTGPAITSLLGSQIQLMFAAMPAAIPHVKAGRLRGLAVSTEKPVNALPGVPAVGETVKGYDVVLWYGVWGPKGLPKDIVALWNKGIAQALQSKELQERMAGEGLEPGGGSPEQFRAVIRRDVEKWKKVVKQAKITVQS